VALAPVDSETLDTLGSAYRPPGSKAHGSTRWLRVGQRRLTIRPGGSVAVPVSVVVSARATPGDYLGGVSIEQLGQRSVRSSGAGVSSASTVRYAIGVETVVPGRRRRLIRFTGARIVQQPAGMTFVLDARNLGNAILGRVHGGVRVDRSGHRLLSRAIAPGTFLANTAIAYPVPSYREAPSPGARYRVRAWLRYSGGIARLDTMVTFGSRQGAVQRLYGHGHAGGGTPWWQIALVAALIAYALVATLLLLRNRSRRRHQTGASGHATHDGMGAGR
jgi:hypothetical protein